MWKQRVDDIFDAIMDKLFKDLGRDVKQKYRAQFIESANDLFGLGFAATTEGLQTFGI